MTVTNPDAQSGSLANAFTVTSAVALAPAVSSVTPTSGGPGQTLPSVVITGSNFLNGATCSFGAGITVSSCTFNSATQLTANLTTWKQGGMHVRIPFSLTDRAQRCREITSGNALRRNRDDVRRRDRAFHNP